MTGKTKYDTNLAMGLGLIQETKTLLGIWSPPMNGDALFKKALASGAFPNLSAYRLRNIVVRCFAQRYLLAHGKPARFLKQLLPALASAEIVQLFFLYTCRANRILADFVRTVYWEGYAAGNDVLSKDDAEHFIRRAIDDGRTPSRWADGQIKRVGRYLTGSCADYGLVGKRTRQGRHIIPYRIEPRTAAYLAHDLHFAGSGDNAVTSHSDWQLFGPARDDVRDELKRLSLKGYFIHQSAGAITHIGWKYKRMEEFVDVLAES